MKVFTNIDNIFSIYQINSKYISMIKDRIIQLLEHKDIPKENFYVKIGMTSASFRGKAKDSPLNSNAIANILSEIPDVSERWLLTGEGDMMKEQVTIHHHPPYNEPMSNDFINLYDIDVAANLKTLLQNKGQNIIGLISIPDMPICDGAIRVRGDSMYPILKSGDIVVYKEVQHLDSLIYGEMYLVDFTLNGDYYLVVKYVRRSDQPNHVRLVSYNTNHDPLDIPLSGIRAIALIKASIRLNTMI